MAETADYLRAYEQAVTTFPDDESAGHHYGLTTMTSQFLGAASYYRNLGKADAVVREFNVFEAAVRIAWDRYAPKEDAGPTSDAGGAGCS